MLMPIVSMNKMAMNESVAATCCYREVASATNVYWEVMNGGWIGSGYVNELNWKNDSFIGWGMLDFDITGVTSANLLTLPALNKRVTVEGKTEFYVITNGLEESVDVFLSTNGVFGRGSSCSHNDGLCTLKVEEIVHRSNQHFESTTKHDTKKKDWTKPHTAAQFNS